MTTRPPDDDTGMFERLDAGQPPSSPDERSARAPYERLLARIRDLEDIAPPTGWETRAAARWSSARRTRRVGIALGAAAGAGLVAALLLLRCAPSTTASGPEVAVLTTSGEARRGAAAVNDVLRMRAQRERTHVELRVYLNTRLIVRCPGSDSCQQDASSVTVDWKLVEPGAYQVVMLSSASAIPPPVDGTIDLDLLRARSAGADSKIKSVPVSH